MLLAGFVWLGPAVISGEISMGWGSVVWCVTAVVVWTWAAAWRATTWRSMKWSGVTPAGVMTAVTPVSRVVWVGSGMTEPVPISIIMVGTPGVAMMPRWGSIMPTGGVISVSVLVCLKVVFYQGSLWQHVHSCYSQNILYEGNSMPCGQFPDIGNTCHCHWTWYWPMK